MSDFPQLNQYRPHQSQKLLQSFQDPFVPPVVLKKSKGQYLYDIDDYKYVDFNLQHGSVLLGHNDPSLCHYIKDALSIGTDHVFYHKFSRRLNQIWQKMIPFESGSFFSNEISALIQLFSLFKAISVQSLYLKEFINGLNPKLECELYQPGKDYDAVIIEPIDFDTGLLTDITHYKANSIISFEIRTGFRVNSYSILNLDKVDYIFYGKCALNGIDSAVLLSRNKTLYSSPIPIYIALGMIEYLKKMMHLSRSWNFPVIQHPLITWQNQSIIGLRKSISPSESLPYGLYINGNILYLSQAHTEYDIRRLKRFLNSLTDPSL